MALRDQPYLPLYVKDFMTDEKLCHCSAEAHGVYIWIMCILHKQQTYGQILLRQNEWQNPSKLLDFARIFARQMPFEVDVIERALTELLHNNVLQFNENDNIISQQRMVKDANLSEKRSNAGKLGAYSKNYDNEFCHSKMPGKSLANSAYANANVNAIENINNKESLEKRKEEFKNNVLQNYSEQFDKSLIEDFCEYWCEHNADGYKMRFEMEKIFDIGRRLKTWDKNNLKFNNNGKSNNQKKSRAEQLASWGKF